MFCEYSECSDRCFIRSIRYREHVKEDPFSLFHPYWRAVLKNVCEIISEKWRTRTERVLDDLKMPKVVEISSTVAIIYHRYEGLAVLKCFCDCFQQVEVLETF